MQAPHLYVAGDRLAAHVGEQLVLAANRRPGLARFEDTALGLALALVGLHPLAPVVLVLATLPQISQPQVYRQRTARLGPTLS